MKSDRWETLGVVIRGHPDALARVLRMLHGVLDVRVVHARRSRGKLWIHEEPPPDSRQVSRQPSHSSAEAQKREQVRGRDGRVLIGDEIYSARYIREVEDEWCKEGLIR